MKRNWKTNYTDALRGLGPETLTRQIDAFNNGKLREFALTCDIMQERDDVLKNVIAKRKKAVARHGWEVLAMDDSPEARAHQQALEYLYNHLRCSHALRQDEQGGFSLLVTQMMDAVAKGWAVHEIAWQPVVRPRTRPAPARSRSGSHLPNTSSFPHSLANQVQHHAAEKIVGSNNLFAAELDHNGPCGTHLRELRDLRGETLLGAELENNGPCSRHLRGETALASHPLANRVQHHPAGVQRHAAEKIVGSNNLFAAQLEHNGPCGTHLRELRALRGESFPSPHLNHNGPCGTHLRGETLLGAELRFVPLWFFEHTSNQLRLQINPNAPSEPLDPAEWLITTGEGIMQACARAYLFKHLPLQSWLDYCQKYGSPGLKATTAAPRGSAEFDAMNDALQEFITNLSIVTNSAESIQLLDLKGSGEPPYIRLVDRMDRVMIALWRGADLSTLSRDNGYGASLQSGESRILEADDARMISETLNNTLDRQVIKMLFGSTVEPLAYVNVLISPREYTAQDLAIDQFLVQHGVPLSISRTLQRYNRAPAEPGEHVLRGRSQ